MALGQKLEIRQGQSLVMTPQLQQAIKLLQLSNVELAEYCEQELERNPLLERDDAPAQVQGEPEAPAAAGIANERADQALSRDDFSHDGDMDQAARDNMYDGDPPAAASGPGPSQGSLTDWTTVKSGGGFEGEDGFAFTIEEAIHMKDNKESQLNIEALTDADRMI